MIKERICEVVYSSSCSVSLDFLIEKLDAPEVEVECSVLSLVVEGKIEIENVCFLKKCEMFAEYYDLFVDIYDLID